MWLTDRSLFTPPSEYRIHVFTCVTEQILHSCVWQNVTCVWLTLTLTECAWCFRLMTQWRFTRGIEDQAKAFLDGMNEVVPLQWLQYFDERELEVNYVSTGKMSGTILIVYRAQESVYVLFSCNLFCLLWSLSSSTDSREVWINLSNVNIQRYSHDYDSSQWHSVSFIFERPWVRIMFCWMFVYEESLLVNCCMAECFPGQSRWCSNEQLCQLVKCEAPTNIYKLTKWTDKASVCLFASSWSCVACRR